MDKILLRGLEARARIGVTGAEREVGQNLQFDIDMYADLSKPGRSDSLQDTISYADAAETVVQIARKQEYRLLERLADEIANALLAGFPIEKVWVRVMKVPPPVDVKMHAAGVEIERAASRQEGAIDDESQ